VLDADEAVVDGGVWFPGDPDVNEFGVVMELFLWLDNITLLFNELQLLPLVLLLMLLLLLLLLLLLPIVLLVLVEEAALLEPAAILSK
jgi:hypothetical protein